jgi:hypothetical protein
MEIPARGPFSVELALEANLAGGMYLLEVCVFDFDRHQDASKSLRRTFHVREEHEFHGVVNLKGRFELKVPELREPPCSGS